MIDIRELEGALETNRLLLEPLSGEHAVHMFAALSDPRIYTFIPQDAPRSLLELQNRYRQLEGRQSPAGDELWLNWAIQIRDCGRYIGLVEATIREDNTELQNKIR
jgi:ribosomal-protein-alanine N-acetyltransferase